MVGDYILVVKVRIWIHCNLWYPHIWIKRSSNIMLAATVDKYRSIYKKACWILWPIGLYFFKYTTLCHRRRVPSIHYIFLKTPYYIILNIKLYLFLKILLLDTIFKTMLNTPVSMRDSHRWEHITHITEHKISTHVIAIAKN